MSERLGNVSTYNQWFGPPVTNAVYYDFRITAPAVDCHLRVVPGAAGAEVLLVGPSEEALARDRDLWLDAVETAVSELGSEHPEHSWYSLLTCEPVFGGETQLLEAAAQVDSMKITPSGVIYWEYQPDKATLDGLAESWSSPVRIEGTDRGFNFSAAQLKAVKSVARLRAILSVVFDERWVIKLSPLRRRIPVPQTHPDFGPSEHPQDIEGYAHKRVSLPAWIDQAWKRADEQPDLADALAVYQEALDLWDGHPSMALVCLIGAIEGMGAKYQDLVRCECCSDCQIHVGSGKRFRAALSVVMSRHEAGPLIAAYSPRSETVHAGRLHGSEHTAGALGLGLTQADPVSDFEVGLIENLRAATREILLRALKGELPELRAW
ncbi:MAG: hypothetical protein M3277_11940 [Actinomycetota bacterium]|nr:hypothetical protein [Actinomycetota bacterium]